MSKSGYSKAKGRDLQNRIAALLAMLFGFEYGKAGSGNPIEPKGMGQSGVDIRFDAEVEKILPFSIECKHGASIDFASAIQQAKSNRRKGTLWVGIVQRTSRQAAKRYGPVIIMDAEEFFRLHRHLLNRMDMHERECVNLIGCLGEAVDKGEGNATD